MQEHWVSTGVAVMAARDRAGTHVCTIHVRIAILHGPRVSLGFSHNTLGR